LAAQKICVREIIRFLGIAVIIASLAVSQDASAQPLSPGKPAGVHEARRGASTGLLIAGGVLVAGWLPFWPIPIAATTRVSSPTDQVPRHLEAQR
jgi:hypothetical protein